MIENTTEYKCLQSQFSVLYNETIQIKDQIEEYHAHVQTLNATFTNKLDMTEVCNDGKNYFVLRYSMKGIAED